MSWTGMAAGAAEGLDKVFARNLQEEASRRQAAQLAETMRQNQAHEGFQNRQLQLQRENAQATQGLTAQLRAQQLAKDQLEETNRQRDDAVRTMALLPAGAPVSPDEYTRFTKTGGAPTGMFEPETQMQGDDGSEPVQTGYKFKGTAGTLHADQMEELARLRAQVAADAAMKGNALGWARENRLTQWGPPVIPVYDPSSPSGQRNVPRSGMPAEGWQAPLSNAQEDSASALKNVLDTIKIVKQHPIQDWEKSIGPITAGVMAPIQKYTGLDVAGGETGTNLRALLNQLETTTAFASGGKSLTANERQMMESFLATIKQNPVEAMRRIQQFEDSTRRSLITRGIDPDARPSAPTLPVASHGPAKPAPAAPAPAAAPAGPKRIKYDLDGNVIP